MEKSSSFGEEWSISGLKFQVKVLYRYTSVSILHKSVCAQFQWGSLLLIIFQDEFNINCYSDKVRYNQL